MTDYQKTIELLSRHRANFTAMRCNNQLRILCFGISYNAKDEVIGYVYLWQDTYTLDGEFIEHKVFEED